MNRTRHEIRHHAAVADVEVAVSWDYDRSEIIADGIIHFVGCILALVGGSYLVWLSLFAPIGDWGEDAAMIIYASCLVVMLGMSATYNMWRVSSIKWWLRRFDHSAIYFLIAATYTPFIAQLDLGATTIALSIFVWGSAIIGVSIKLAFPGRFDRMSIYLYLIMGWSGVAIYEPVVRAISPTALWLLAAGGLLYCMGIAFHVWHSLRFQNSIWHAFVLMASTCHFFAVLNNYVT